MRKLIVILMAVLFIFVVSGLVSYAQGKTEEFAGETFIKAPKNPKTPEEVVGAFYLLVKEEKYTEAEKLVAQNFLGEFRHGRSEIRDVMQIIQSIETKGKDILDHNYWYVSVHFIESGLDGSYYVDEKTLDDIKKGRPVKLGDQENQRVKLLSINEEHKKDAEVCVYLTFHIVDNSGTEYDEPEYLGYEERALPVNLVKQNGEWKMTWLSGRNFIRTPKNLDTPEKVVVAFFFLLKEGKYSEAKKLIAPNPSKESIYNELTASDAIQIIQSIRVNRRDVLKDSYWEATLYFIKEDSKANYNVDEETLIALKKGEPVKIGSSKEAEYVKLLSVDGEHIGGEEATIYFTFHFCARTDKWDSSKHLQLVKLNGDWKIVK